MKKIFTVIILAGLLGTQAFSQPTASITIENPRIDGNRFYWDVYFMRTNDDASWNNFGNHMLGDCSWYWEFNLVDLTNYVIEEEDPTVFGASYTNSIGQINGNLRINTVFSPVTPTNIELNVWYKAFTCSAEITGDDTQLSGLSWDMINTGLTTYTNQSVIETDYDSDCDIALNTNCWTGNGGNGDWDNTANWSSGSIPDNSTNVIYPYNSTLELSGFNTTDFAQVNNFRVNHNAKFIVPQNKGLTVFGDIELKGDTNIILPGSTSAVLGIMYSSALIPKGTITYNGYALEDGHIKVYRNLYYEATDQEYYHHQVAAPVANVTLGDWDMQHEYSWAYEYRADNSWWNISEPTRPTNPGYGFILSLYGSSGFETSTQKIEFVDNLVLGPVNPAINPGTDVLSLIGNPYTAPISWDYIIGDAANTQNMNDVVYIWNPDGGSYVSYTSSEGGAGNQSARYIQPGQAFFVQASDLSPTLNLVPADRSENMEVYLKSSTPAFVLRLFTAGGNTTWDETYIRFVDAEVTGAYDRNYDALEWPSSYGASATEIFTVSNQNENLAIDSRPFSPDLMSVPLSFKAAVESEYSLNADPESIESFSPGTEIYLEDLMHPEQGWLDLREFNTYTFDASPEDNYARFMVHFQIKDFGIDELAEKPVNIYSDRTDAIIMNNSGQIIREIQVFDITGNLMITKGVVSDDNYRIFVSNNTGYYVVKVITDKAVYSEKVLITK